MKRLLSSCIALAFALACTMTAFAIEVPTDTTVQNLNGVQQYIVTFTVEPGTDPKALIEEPFDYEGYTYTYASITKHENYFQDEKVHSEVVTVETAKKDLSEVLSALMPSMEYDDGQYSGVLNLDHTTIHTEAAGYTTKSYTVSETKEIGNLDSNDMAYVPSTTVKDGKTIQLASVDWHVQGTALVDDILVPSTYKAIATYSGKAYYSAATGYITTAEYVGEVSCDEVKDITYTVVYVGNEIQPEKVVEEKAAPTIPEHIASNLRRYLGIGAGIAAVAALVVMAMMLLRTRKENEQLRALNAENDGYGTDVEFEETEDES